MKNMTFHVDPYDLGASYGKVPEVRISSPTSTRGIGVKIVDNREIESLNLMGLPE